MNYLVAKYNNLINKKNMVNANADDWFNPPNSTPRQPARMPTPDFPSGIKKNQPPREKNADDWFNPPQPLPPTQQKPNYEEELIRLLKEKGQDVTQEEYDKLLKEYISAKESGYEPPQSTNPIDERQWHSNPHPINPVHQPVKLPVTQEKSIALSGNSRLLENRASMPNYGANRGYQIPFNPFSAQYSQQKPQSMTVNSTRNLLGKKYNNKNLGSKFANKKNYNF